MCYREGHKRHGRWLTLFVRANGLAEPRIGVTVVKRVGNSVVRHRLKRVLKEAFRRLPERSGLGGVDVVAHPRPGSPAADSGVLAGELRSLLARRR